MSTFSSGAQRITNPGEWRNDLLTCALQSPRPEPQALSLVDRFGAVRSLEKIAILTVAPTVERLMQLDHYAIERIIGHSIPKARWAPRALREDAARDEMWNRSPERHVLWFGDSAYPSHLRRIFDPPAVLYGWGQIADSDATCPPIAMVGTRNPDDAGRIAAFELGGAAAAWGMPVVSGLALGIDSAGHRGALAAGKGNKAIVVLGSGIDTIYPRRNRDVAAALLDGGGLILSEYPPGIPPRKYQFPARNRIIAGLCDALVLFQAPEDSGSLITASFALQIGLTVLVHSSGASWTGGKALTADGAHVVGSLSDLLEELTDAGVISPRVASSGVLTSDRRDGSELQNEEERRKLALFGSVAQPESVESWRGSLQTQEVAL